MKIERVSDTQLKLTLTKADLAERDIQLEDPPRRKNTAAVP